MRRLLSACALALLLTGAGCGTRGSLYTGALAPLPFVATEGALIQVVPQTSTAVVLPGDGSPPRAVPISPGARSVTVSPTRQFVAIIGG
ncbi:MAG: hypothetical protein ACK4YP_19010, partial [Myxococcota bacterium]